MTNADEVIVKKKSKKSKKDKLSLEEDTVDETLEKKLKVKKEKKKSKHKDEHVDESPLEEPPKKKKKKDNKDHTEESPLEELPKKKKKKRKNEDIPSDQIPLVETDQQIVNNKTKSPIKKKKKPEVKEAQELNPTKEQPNILKESFQCEGFGMVSIENNTQDILSQKSNPYQNKLYSKWAKKDEFCDYTKLLPCKNVGRPYTVSIAVPASILEDTCLLEELRTFVVGQIARAACIYAVDEIVVFDDGCWNQYGRVPPEDLIGMMKMILEYQECPQYMRKCFFPFHPYTRKVGVLNALNAPHHLRSNEWCTYRDGFVTEEVVNNKFSLVNTGLRTYVQVDSKIPPGMRVTVKFPPEGQFTRKPYGTVVSPKEPREKAGLYWGYSVRVAKSLSEVFVREEEPKSYDLIIGTSEKGVSAESLEIGHFEHALIVFGGVEGLEAAAANDKSLSKSTMDNVFHHYVNTCPSQQSRTIRTEEAILITLSALSSKLKC